MTSRCSALLSKFKPKQDKRTANPAPKFFDKPIISGRNLEVSGIYTQSTNPGQQYVQSLLSSGSISGENLRLLNVKYVVLAKEVDWAWYRDVLNDSGLERVFDSENLAIYENPERVSRFYETDELSPQTLEPLDYEFISPVEYRVREGAEKYTVFVPPNLDSGHWRLDGEKSRAGYYAVWEDGGNKVEYNRFGTYMISYVISIISAVGIVIAYLVLRKRGQSFKELFVRSCLVGWLSRFHQQDRHLRIFCSQTLKEFYPKQYLAGRNRV